MGKQYSRDGVFQYERAVSTSSFLTQINFFSCKQVALKHANPFATGSE